MTIEELIEKRYGDQIGLFGIRDMKSIAIEFATYHVKKALRSAAEKAELEKVYENPVNPSMGWYEIVDKDSILHAYLLENIK